MSEGNQARRFLACVMTVALVIGSLCSLSAADDIITSVVGGGVNVGNGDGEVAANSAIYSPIRTVMDADGHVYFSQPGLRRVRRIDAVTGLLSTYAGNGSFGSAGVGGVATAASIGFPCGLAFDTQGNLFITDRGQPNSSMMGPHRICRVDRVSGILTVVAGAGPFGSSGDGGAATSANFNFPSGIAVDGVGNLYIADQFNHRIRKIDVGTGLISTIAGTGTAGFSGDGDDATLAQLNQPNAVAVDGSGNVYIADESNHCIRMIDTMGDIHTVAGTGGVSGFSGDGGSATAATLYQAGDIAVATNGDFYLVDVGNRRVRMVSGGIISTVAGSGWGNYLGDGGPALLAKFGSFWSVSLATDGSNDLLIADPTPERIRKVTRTTGLIHAIAGLGGVKDGGQATSAILDAPSDVAVDAAGNRFVVDRLGHRVRRVDVISGEITTLTGDGRAAYGGDGGVAGIASVAFPRSIVVTGAGTIYIADTNNNCIRRIEAGTQIISTIAGTGIAGFSGDGGPAAAAQFRGPTGLCLDGTSGLYVIDANNYRLRRIDFGTGEITTIAGDGVDATAGDDGPAASASLAAPNDVCVDQTGRVVISGATVRRIANGSTTITSLPVGFASNGCVADEYGNVYLSDAASDRVARLAQDGSLTWVVGSGTAGYSGDDGPAGAAQISGPMGLAIDEEDRLLIADSDNDRVRQVTFAVIPGKPAGGSPPSGGGSSGGGGCGLGGAATTMLLLLLCSGWSLMGCRRWDNR